MSNVDDENEDGENGTAESTSAKTLRKQNSKLAADLAEAQAAIAKFAAKDRANSIVEFLDANKAPKKLAKYVARDLEGEVTPEGVRKWLEDEGELFGWEPDSGDESEDEDPEVRAAGRISRTTTDAPPNQAGITEARLRSMSLDDIGKQFGLTR